MYQIRFLSCDKWTVECKILTREEPGWREDRKPLCHLGHFSVPMKLFQREKFIYLFIFGCPGSLLRCTGFSLQWPLPLQSTGSRRPGFSSCGARAQLLRGMWDLPAPGLQPVSPALAGGFFTTVPPGKSPKVYF